MKRLYIPAILALLASCSQIEKDAPVLPEEEITPAGYKVLTITAQKADDTKTSYAGDVTFSWNVGDKISVICNDGTQNLWETFDIEEASTSSKFKATVADNINMGALDGSKVALYPASDNHVFTSTASGEISFHIPAERDFCVSDGGHQESAIPMFAWGADDDTYAFSNLTGAAKFTFTNVPCSEVKMVYTVPGVKLNGTYSLLFDSINKADASDVHWDAADAAHDSEKTVTYYGDVVGNSVSFYLPYTQGTISGPSTLQLIDVATNTVLYNNTHVGNIIIHKNQIAVLPGLNLSFHSAYNIDWSGVPQATNSSDFCHALRKLKATADATYIYLYIEALPGYMCLEHDYDSLFHLYKENASGSTMYWYDYEEGKWIKHSEIDAAHDKWASKDGIIAFLTNSSDAYSSNLLMHPNVWYYEIRMQRSVDPAFASAGSVKIGVVLDDTYKQGDESGQYNFGDPYGVIPTYGEDNMYELTLP